MSNAEKLNENLVEIKSQTDALLAYANSQTGKDDPDLGEAIRSLVEGMGSGGSGETWELVDSLEWSMNVARDTMFNQITPSTSYQNVVNAQNNIKNIVLDEPIDQDEYDIVILTSAYLEYKYKGDLTYSQKTLWGKSILQYRYGNVANIVKTSYPANSKLDVKCYTQPATGLPVFGTANIYGFSLALNTGTIKTSSSETGTLGSNSNLKYFREIGISIPTITIRANSAETPLDSLKDLDAENMDIMFGAYIYKAKNTIYDMDGRIRRSMTNGHVGL